MRLWVNGQLIVNNWTDHAPTENSGTIALTAGQRYDIRMEFYENGGGATAQAAVEQRVDAESSRSEHEALSVERSRLLCLYEIRVVSTAT